MNRAPTAWLKRGPPLVLEWGQPSLLLPHRPDLLEGGKQSPLTATCSGRSQATVVVAGDGSLSWSLYTAPRSAGDPAGPTGQSGEQRIPLRGHRLWALNRLPG